VDTLRQTSACRYRRRSSSVISETDLLVSGSKEISWEGLEYILESGQAEAYNYKIDFYQPFPMESTEF
jgi:hypothetical protein